MIAPTAEECLVYLKDLETAFGGERKAAMVIGPSIITQRSWKQRRTMSIPSRRLVWITWCLLLHPERLETLFDLVTWGRFSTNSGEDGGANEDLAG